MTCPVCKKATHRLLINSHGKACANCFGLSELAGNKVDGSITRASQRIRDQQRRHEGDIISPHKFDKLTNKIVPNPDFVKHHPDKLGNFFTQKELEKNGYGGLGKAISKSKKAQKKHAANQYKGVTYRTKK